MSAPLFIIYKSGADPRTVHCARKVTLSGAHVAEVSSFPYTKTTKKRQPARLHAGNYGFAVTSSGYAQKFPDGTSLRKASPEGVLAVEFIDERIAELREQVATLLSERERVLVQAWENGDTVQLTDAEVAK